MANKDGRSRVWAFVAYPESLPENWLDYLTDTHIECCISPLHDKDLNPTGNVKKAHYHVILKFGSHKSYEQVLELIEPLNCTIPQSVNNIKGYVRYLVHKDNPEKVQYDELCIMCLNGFDCSEFLRSTGQDRYFILAEIIDWIDINGVTEFKDLMNYCRKENFDWFKVICDSSIAIREYIKSCRHYGK